MYILQTFVYLINKNTKTKHNMENLTIEIATVIYLVSTTIYLVLTAKKRVKISKNNF